jgi:hypothetical protein
MLVKFLAQRRSAGEFLGSVNLHRTGTANRRAAGIAQRESPVALVLDADQGIEHRQASTDIETKFFRMRDPIDLGIEPLDGKREAHIRREA